MSFLLRPYQAIALAGVQSVYKRGRKRALLAMATGSGKSAMMRYMLEKTPKRTLILCHRAELLDMICESLTVPYGVIGGTQRCPVEQVHVGMMQTVSRRLADLPEYEWVISDECLAGDTLLETDAGAVQIGNFPESGATQVLTMKDGAPALRRITAWMQKGMKPTIKIGLSDGRAVVCTHDHLFYLAGKWVSASKLNLGDALVSHAGHAPAVATPSSHSTLADGGASEFPPHASADQNSTGSSDTRNMQNAPHSAPAVAHAPSSQSRRALHTYNMCCAALRNTLDSCLATNCARSAFRTFFPSTSANAFSDHCLETAQSGCRTPRQQITGWSGRTASRRESGSITKPPRLPAFIQRSPSRLTPDMATPAFGCERHAFRLLRNLLAWLSEMVKNASRSLGLTKSGMRVWRGGIATTAISASGPRTSTPRGIAGRKSRSSGFGWSFSSGRVQRSQPIAATSTSDCPSAPPSGFSAAFTSLSPGACATNSVTIVSIEQAPSCEVFDISVEDTHSFFANGVLVHNCHLAMAPTWRAILQHYSNAWHLGLSATPCRLDGQGLGLEYDEIVYGPSIRELTERGYLVPLRCFAPTGTPRPTKKSGADYNLAEAAAELDRPAIIGNVVKEYQRLAPGRQAIVFCCSRDHAEHMARQFVAAGISAVNVDGSMSNADRKSRIDEFRAKRLSVLTNVDLLTTGWDCPQVEVGIFARPTQSLALYLQMIGRILRIHPGKADAVLIDHVGNVIAHGMPDENREWSLEGKIKQKKPLAVACCPKCYASFRPQPKCPSCGCSLGDATKARRDIAVREGEIGEVDAARILQLREAKLNDILKGVRTYAGLEEIRKARGYKVAWTFMQMKARHIPWPGKGA